MLYNTLKLLIARGRTAGMQDKLDTLYALDRLDATQYAELVAMLPAEA